MAENTPKDMYKKGYLDKIAKIMLNNEEFSDVTLVVNKKHYYACKIVMSVASSVFASLITEHFKHCMDKLVLVSGVKYNVSFLNILRYIHGVEINLRCMSKDVLCEMLSLTQEYKLHEFHSDLKVYVSKLTHFKVNSVVQLLNTAKTYQLVHLYDKLQIYVYQHVEEVINHKSFVNLKYEVLLDLIKSDYLYGKEITILIAALNWHIENIIDVADPDEIIHSEIDTSVPVEEDTIADNNTIDSSLDLSSKLNDENVKDGGIQELEVCHTTSEFICVTETLNEEEHTLLNIKDRVLNKEEHELLDINERELNKEELTLLNIRDRELNKEKHTPLDINESDLNKDEHTLLDIKDQNEQKTSQGVLEVFSANILKTLLKEIRFDRITMFDYIDAKKIEIFTKYEDRIVHIRNNLEINKVQRKKYSGINQTFTIKGISKEDSKDNLKTKKAIDSEESYSRGNYTWKARCRFNSKSNDNDVDGKYLGIFLYCESKLKKWDFTNAARLTLLSHNSAVYNISRKYDQHTLNNIDSDWGYITFISLSDLFNPDNQFIQNDTITIEVLEMLYGTNEESS